MVLGTHCADKKLLFSHFVQIVSEIQNESFIYTLNLSNNATSIYWCCLFLLSIAGFLILFQHIYIIISLSFNNLIFLLTFGFLGCCLSLVISSKSKTILQMNVFNNMFL